MTLKGHVVIPLLYFQVVDISLLNKNNGKKNLATHKRLKQGHSNTESNSFNFHNLTWYCNFHKGTILSTAKNHTW